MIFYSPDRGLAAVHSTSKAPRIKFADSVFVKYKGAFFGKMTRDSLKAVQAAKLPVGLDNQVTWSGAFSPMPHQLEDIRFMLQNRRCTILDDMGVGKTAAALWAANVFMVMGVAKRVLVLCPKSCLHDVWGNECFNVVPHQHCEVMGANERSKGSIYINSGSKGFLVVNHDATRSEGFINLLKREWMPDIIIVDEASAYKNPTALRSKALQGFVRDHDPMVWLMTGTPTPNGPIDALGLHRVLYPDSTWTQRRFRMNHMVQLSTYKWVPRRDAMDAALELLQPSIRHKRDDCFALPDNTYTRREVEYSKAQVEALKAMQRYLHARIEGTAITAPNAAVQLGKLLQIACGSVINSAGEPTLLDHNRDAAVLEVVDQAPEKVVVFAPYTASLSLLKKYLNKHGHPRAQIVWGQTTDMNRVKYLREFKDPNGPKVLLAHPRTMAHGLTLTVATTVVWYCPVMSLEQYQQANARIHRKGQQKKCQVVHLEASQFEKDLYDALLRKAKMQDFVLELAESILLDNRSVV